MSSLKYAGVPSSRGTGVVSKLQVSNLLNSAIPNRTSAASDALAASAPYAAKTYVDSQDATFKLPSYFQAQDLLNVPLTSTGQPNGISSLDPFGKIPVAQIPALGSGFIYGPFSPTATFATSASNTPLKIADWHIGVQSLTFQPLAFVIVVASCSTGGRPVVEIRLSNGAKSYASQTLIGIGMGRSGYTDPQPIPILPAPATTSQSGTTTGWSPSTDIWATAWLYDAASHTSTVGTGGMSSGAIFLARVAQ